MLLFSCLRPELSAARAATVATGGIWAVTADPGATSRSTSRRPACSSTTGSTSASWCATGTASWVLLAFLNRGPDDTFVGAVSDPMPVVMTADGLQLA